MRVTMILADSAQAVDGKLFILGGGWSLIPPEPVAPTAVGLIFQVPWDLSDRKHKFVLELMDADGNIVSDLTGNELRVLGEFETGRPPGHKRGSSIDSCMAVNVPPLQLDPDARYEWRLDINGEVKDDWRLPFTTRPAGQLPPGFPAA